MPVELPETLELDCFHMAVVKGDVDRARKLAGRRMRCGNGGWARTVPGNRERTHAKRRPRRSAGGKVRGREIGGPRSPPVSATPSSPPKVYPIGKKRGARTILELGFVHEGISPPGIGIPVIPAAPPPATSGYPVILDVAPGFFMWHSFPPVVIPTPAPGAETSICHPGGVICAGVKSTGGAVGASYAVFLEPERRCRTDGALAGFPPILDPPSAVGCVMITAAGIAWPVSVLLPEAAVVVGDDSLIADGGLPEIVDALNIVGLGFRLADHG